MMRDVVIADDSATARMFIRRCLEIAGLDEAVFREVTNGREALDAMKSQRPDLLVTDLTMPDMDGVELLTRLAASPLLHGVAVVVVSSQTNPKVEAELNALGVKAILAKPVNPAGVAAALATVQEGEG